MATGTRGAGDTHAEITTRSLIVAAAATVGMMTSSPSVVSAPLGLFLIPVSHAFSIGRGTFSLLTGGSMIFGAALTPLAGQAMDRYGVRRVVLPGALALAVVEILLAVMPVKLPVLAALLIFQGVVSCAVTPLAYTKVLSLWFQRRRGLMLGLASAFGVGGGAGLSAVLVGSLMGHGGWRTAYLGLGVYVLIIGLPCLALFLREPDATAPQPGVARHEPPGLSLAEALGSKAFLLVLTMVIASLGGITVMMLHGPALLAGRGLNVGAGFLGCVALGSVTGQIISGLLLDRIDSPKIGLIFATATLIGGITILHFGTTVGIVLPAAVVMGLGQGAEVGLASYYISRFCGLRAYASIFGVVMTAVTVSAGVFPFIAGYVFDHTGSYDLIIPAVDALLVLAAVAILLMPRYRFAVSGPLEEG